jgi:hypothetical protein
LTGTRFEFAPHPLDRLSLGTDIWRREFITLVVHRSGFAASAREELQGQTAPSGEAPFNAIRRRAAWVGVAVTSKLSREMQP